MIASMILEKLRVAPRFLKRNLRGLFIYFLSAQSLVEAMVGLKKTKKNNSDSIFFHLSFPIPKTSFSFQSDSNFELNVPKGLLKL